MMKKNVNRIKIIGSYGIYSVEQLQIDTNKFLETLPDEDDLKDIKFFYYPSSISIAVIYKEDIEIAKERTKNEELDIKKRQEQEQQYKNEEAEELQKQKLEILKNGKHKGRPKRIESFN